MMPSYTRWQPRKRAGAVVVLALAVFAAITLLVAGALQLFAAQHRALRQEQYQQQAWWLAEAGLERAAALLAENPEYSGEVWQLGPAELPGAHAATVTIQVEPAEADSPTRRIEAVSTYPADEPNSSRQRRTLLFHAAQPQNQPQLTPGGNP